jgi:hypothetical protein
MDISALVHIVLVLIIVGMIAGLLWWLVGKAPFLPEPFKSVIQWVILAVCVIFLIYAVLLPLVSGGGSIGVRPLHR